MEEGKKYHRDTLATFREHTPLIMEEETTKNKLRQQKLIFDRQNHHTHHIKCVAAPTR
jgi:hypothetical protein